MLQCFAALPTKLYPESNNINYALLANHESLPYFQDGRQEQRDLRLNPGIVSNMALRMADLNNKSNVCKQISFLYMIVDC